MGQNDSKPKQQPPPQQQAPPQTTGQAKITEAKKMASRGSWEDKYTLKEELGRGAFSIVRKCVEIETGTEYAMKIIAKGKLTGGKARSTNEEKLWMEVAILKEIDHDGVIRLHDLYDTDERLFLIMELAEGGELFDKIVEKGSYTEEEAAQVVRTLCQALQYLHLRGIVHRDLKPENLLLKSRDDDVTPAIADFGLSKIIGKKTMMKTVCGTPSYVAPEVLAGTGSYGKEVDMWSVGVITYLLLCGFPPFYAESIPDIFEQIINVDYDFPEEYWDCVSAQAQNFVQALLEESPAKRLSAEDALKHPWLSGEGVTYSQNVEGAARLKDYIIERRLSSAVLNEPQYDL